MENQPKKVIRIRLSEHWKSLLGIIILVVLVIIGIKILFPSYRGNIPVMMGIEGGGSNAIDATQVPRVDLSYDGGAGMMPYYNNTPSITDTREFMKTYYSSELKTRKVSRTAREVRGIIRDHEGRIDGDNASEKSASIRFVVPKSELDSFIGDIEEIVPAKFYIENTSSENLLGQKQSIEEQTVTTQKSLTDLQAQQKSLAANHTARVADLKQQIATAEYQLSVVQRNLDGMFSANPNYSSYTNQKLALENDLRNLNRSLTGENNNYSNQSANFKEQINQVNGQLSNLKTQDTKLIENVETVSGTIQITWVSIWEIVKIYVPFPPVIIIILFALIAWYLLVRKNIVPMVAIGW